MEINKTNDVIGVQTNEDIVEGRMVLMVANVNDTHDFGSRGDLPGVKLPDSDTEAGQAKFVVAFAYDNSQTPLYGATNNQMPSRTFALRQGFDSAANVPFSATVYLTQPSMLVGQTIPSGSLALAFAGGVYTVPSGSYVYSADLVPGARLEVLNSADDGANSAGMLAYSATGNIGIVERVTSDRALQFRTYNP